MNRRNKAVVIEKDGVRGEATEVSLKGLLKHGWTVVDDGDKDVKKLADEQAKEEQKLNETVEKVFGTDEEK